MWRLISLILILECDFYWEHWCVQPREANCLASFYWRNLRDLVSFFDSQLSLRIGAVYTFAQLCKSDAVCVLSVEKLLARFSFYACRAVSAHLRLHNLSALVRLRAYEPDHCVCEAAAHTLTFLCRSLHRDTK